MSPPENSLLATFEQLCHDISNPLMVVSGNAHLLERDVLHLTGISDGEREQLMVELAAIKRQVNAAVMLMDQERWRITEERESDLEAQQHE